MNGTNKPVDVPFDDSIDNLFDRSHLPKQAGELPSIKDEIKTFDQKAERGMFEEGCPKCGGTGRFRSYTGRDIGRCFHCKGEGKFLFKTSREERTRNRTNATVRKAKAEGAWREQFAAEVAWLTKSAQWQQSRRDGKPAWQFPIDLLAKLDQYGSLTDGQVEAVRKFMARDAERKAAPAVTATVDASKIEQAFATARERADRPGAIGIWTKPLTLRANDLDITFQPGSVGSQWEGMVFVKAGEKKLGHIKDGAFTRKFACNDAETAAVVEACQDPSNAARAFGKAWSRCTICGQTLTNDESIERGIGPICAERYGF